MFKDVLRKARIAAGLSKAELARRLDMKYTTYDGYETGRRNPKPSDLPKMAEALDVDVKYFINNLIYSELEETVNNGKYINTLETYIVPKTNDVYIAAINKVYPNLSELGKFLLYKNAEQYISDPDLRKFAEEESKNIDIQKIRESVKIMKLPEGNISSTADELEKILLEAGYTKDQIIKLSDRLKNNITESHKFTIRDSDDNDDPIDT